MNKVVESIIEGAIENAKMRKSRYVTEEDLLLESISYLQDLNVIDFSDAADAIIRYIEGVDELHDQKTTKLLPTIGLTKVLDRFQNSEYVSDIFQIMTEEIKSEFSLAYKLSKEAVTTYSEAIEQLRIKEEKTEKDSQIEVENKASEINESDFPNLSKYGENLSIKERRNPLIGRDSELQRIIEILLKKDKPNPVLTGNPGVGKTAVVEELAVRIREGNVPKALEKVSAIYSISMSGLLSGSMYRGDFEEKLESVLKEVKSSDGKIILYVDEFHTIMGTGATMESPLDASNILKPYLTDGSVKMIGSTTIEEYRKFIERDTAIARRFASVDIPEPSVEDSIKIIEGIKSGYEDFHEVKYKEEAVRAAVELSAKHIHDRFLPDKAIELIDEAGAKKAARRTSGNTKTATIKAKDIEEVLFRTYKIPKTTMVKDETAAVKNLADNLEKKIFGQEEAVKALIKRIKLAKAGIRDTSKPIANILFVGPTGTGKTEITKVLSESLNMKLLRFDMSEYSESHSVAKLFGSPAGYVGHEDGGILTNAVRSEPNCVLLLDEIEKAHPTIYNSLLQIMDYGMMTDSKGVKVDFRNTILIMTSNAGAKQIVKKNLGFGKSSETVDSGAMDSEIKNIFTPEFRGRLTDIIKFNDITPEIAVKIVEKEIKALSKTLSEKKVKIRVTDSCVKHIAETGYTPMTGARNIKNLVTNDISNLIVDDLLFGSLKNGGSVTIDWDKEYIKKVKEPVKKNKEPVH